MKCLASLLAMALGAAMPPAQAQAQGPALGRLFSSPTQRSELEAQRNGAAPGGPAVQAVEQAPPPPPPPPAEPVVLNGLVKRSSGKSTVWLNQVPQNDANNSFVKGASPALSLQLSSGRKVILKPGQSFNPNDGSVSETDGR